MTKNVSICAVDDCDIIQWARGFCPVHYRKFLKYDNPLGEHTPPPKPVRFCEIENCENPHYMRQWCRPHYSKWQKYGDPLSKYIRKTCEIESCQNFRTRAGGRCDKHYLEDLRNNSKRPNFNVKHLYEEGRYLEFIEAVKVSICDIDEKGCWVWKRGGALGYGRLSIFDKDQQAHRVMLQASLGGIDLGVDQVHHICANRGCVNPDHLQLLSAQENMAEMHERKYYKNRIAELEQQVIALQKQLDEVRMSESH